MRRRGREALQLLAGLFALLLLLLVRGSAAKAVLPLRWRPRQVDETTHGKWGRSGSRRLHDVVAKKTGSKANGTADAGAVLALGGGIRGSGYFFTDITLGTPAQPFHVIIDTGSTILYVHCRDCKRECGTHANPPFDRDASDTSALVQCNAPGRCFKDSMKCMRGNCAFERRYVEQSSVNGIVLEDRLHLGEGLEATVSFGCATTETGELLHQEADGVLGLGRARSSIVDQMAHQGAAARAFGLCFGGAYNAAGGGGVIVFGDLVPKNSSLVYTKLLHSNTRKHQKYYQVGLTSLSFGDEELGGINKNHFRVGYGSVIDSGTTFSYFQTSIYKASLNAVKGIAAGADMPIVDGPEPQYDDVCFQISHTGKTIDELFPILEMAFSDGTTLGSRPENYMFKHIKQSGAWCFGIFDNGNIGNLIGGLTFRNMFLHYDVQHSRIGFQRLNCSELEAAAQETGNDIIMEPSPLYMEAVLSDEIEAYGDLQFSFSNNIFRPFYSNADIVTLWAIVVASSLSLYGIAKFVSRVL